MMVNLPLICPVCNRSRFHYRQCECQPMSIDKDARIAELKAKLEEARRGIEIYLNEISELRVIAAERNVWIDAFRQMRSQLTAANAAIDKARKALEPFAERYSNYDRDDEPITVLGKDLRRARATLTELNARKDNEH